MYASPWFFSCSVFPHFLYFVPRCDILWMTVMVLSVPFSCIFQELFQRGFGELHQAVTALPRQACLYLVGLPNYGVDDLDS